MKSKISTNAAEEQMIQLALSSLKEIYANKSSDEYKSHGDITRTSEYKSIEKMIAGLGKINKFPKQEASELRTLFLTLHRPVFSKMVTEYIHEPNDSNTIFTAVYTVGYRVLISELSRIYTSTVPTANEGIVYKPDKVSKRNNMSKFIRSFNSSLEQKINMYIKSVEAESLVTEAFADVTTAIVGVSKKAYILFNKVFKVLMKDSVSMAPINRLLTMAFNHKVDRLDKIIELYQATLEAYEEYMRIPESQRKKKVESKYIKNLKKYEIKMNNIKAQIAHYDYRAKEEVNNSLSEMTTNDKLNEPDKPESNDDTKDDLDF
mgnify:FL=1